jgi:dynein heavy chain
VRDNLHIVLAMSPVGEAFRNRLRMYPGLVNCTTIDYFTPWPDDALMAVAEKFMGDVDLDVPMPGEVLAPVDELDAGAEKRNVVEDVDFAKEKAAWIGGLRLSISKTFALIHQSVIRQSDTMLEEIRRHNFVTPINYLELVSGYKALLAEKRQELGDQASAPSCSPGVLRFLVCAGGWLATCSSGWSLFR